MRSWIDEARRPVLDVAAALGVPADARKGMACPSCGEEHRDRKRGAVGLRQDGAGWRCHKCGATGDGIDLAAFHLENRRLRDLDRDAQRRVKAWFEAQGWTTALVSPSTTPTRPTILLRVPQEEVERFWDASRSLTIARQHDPEAVAFLRERGLERSLDTIAAADLARLTPTVNGTPWPSWWPAGRARAWRLLVRAGDDWREVRLLEGQAFTTKLDAFNEVLFEPVATDAIRMEVRLREGFSGGVLEWEVGTAE